MLTKDSLFLTNLKPRPVKAFTRKGEKTFAMKHFFLTISVLISIVSFGRVQSSFTCDAVSGCSPLVVNITDHSTGGVTSWSWNLGNGNTSTQRNPSATYFTPGVYTVKLVVSGGGFSDSSTQVVTVFRKPSVDFTSDKVTACPNDSIHFTTLTTPGDAPLSQYAWGFGNGIANRSMNAVYQYSISGTYDVTLVVEDTNGCIANITKPAYIRIWPTPTAAFTASPTSSCGLSQPVTFTDQSQGTGLTYQWSFGDSTFSNVSNSSHLYQYGKYKASLTVTNNDGCKNSIQQNISVVNLHADFTADRLTACTGESISFTNLSPMPGTAWAWTFGDSTTSAKQNPSHIYTNPGIYSVTFVVKDGACKDSITKVAYIRVTQGFLLSFAANQQNSCTTPFAVSFTSSASAPVSYLWNFGNGHTDTTANPTTTYTVPSVFSVTLTAVDSNGCTVVSSAPALINTSTPLTNFVCDTLVCPGASVQFTNRTQNAIHYVWHFGDGDTSTLTNPTHIYRSFGRYTVSLTGIDSLGCDSTIVRHSLVNVDSTKIDFVVDEKFSMCPPLVSVFSSMANRPDLKYKWDFGDGYTDTAANPTHIFFHPGLYTVTLIGTSKQGCTDTIVYPRLIDVEGPSGHFSATPANGCVPLVVDFTGSISSNVQTVTCDLGDGRFYNDSVNFQYTYNALRSYHPRFILTDHVGCTVPYDLDSITTHPVPVLSLIADTSVCVGQPVRMTLGSDHYSWAARIVCDSCGRVPDVVDTVAVATLTPQVTTTYSVTATNIYGCITTGRFSINVVPLPVLVPHDTIRLCQNEVTSITAMQADSVRWEPATYLSDPTALSPVCTPTSSIVYTVTGYNRLGCGASQQVPVKVTNKVTVTLSGDTTVCPGNDVQLKVTAIDSSVKGVSYQWSPTPYFNNSQISNPSSLMEQTETFRVITTSGTCIPDTSTVTVHVNPAGSVKASAMVTTTPHAEVPLDVVSGDLTSYLWTAKDSLSCADCRSTTLIPIASQVVYVTGTNQYGCPATDSVYINVLQCDPASIFVPNTFTPNNDGLHDVLYVRSRTLAQMDYFRIFDRWGALVYESKDMSQGWNGEINGKAAEQGVYVYTVSGKCESGYDIEASGTATLIR